MSARRSKPVQQSPIGYPRGSVEGRALAVLFRIAGLSSFFYTVHVKGDMVWYSKPVTLQLAALAKAPSLDDWPTLNYQHAAAWEKKLLRDNVTVRVRKHLIAGDRAPWPWPPSVEGKLYPITGPPPLGELSEAEAEDFT